MRLSIALVSLILLVVSVLGLGFALLFVVGALDDHTSTVAVLAAASPLFLVGAIPLGLLGVILAVDQARSEQVARMELMLNVQHQNVLASSAY